MPEEITELQELPDSDDSEESPQVVVGHSATSVVC
jgi:hypothetical protein